MLNALIECSLLTQVRQNLHVVLCFSPVGDKFRIRARQFPALVNCMQYDWCGVVTLSLLSEH